MTDIIDRLIFCKMIYEVQNSFNHLLIITILNLRAQRNQRNDLDTIKK